MPRVRVWGVVRAYVTAVAKACAMAVADAAVRAVDRGKDCVTAVDPTVILHLLSKKMFIFPCGAFSVS